MAKGPTYLSALGPQEIPGSTSLESAAISRSSLHCLTIMWDLLLCRRLDDGEPSKIADPFAAILGMLSSLAVRCCAGPTHEPHQLQECGEADQLWLSELR